ncbi:hypothetical protein GCM10009837_43420 [Streptomyces durmitorensis]|uniref:Integral membrane protein n=1 Tax=Streptomyces durmitorensis TaxID=319947 RepID=A0ABY4Q5Z7_9ACTN|nr:hypothetical protein [Streptomyces durmitorensis]UQT60648.1 hypothetical protein M4V62_39360 [Streptomyces durmitorensis]
MAKTLSVPLAGMEYRGPLTAVRTPRRTGGQGWVAAVAVAFTLAQLALVRPGMGLGWDEAVYVSQVSGHAPAAFFSAPRSRGISLLVAPIASWSSSTELLRVYLSLLSGLGLFLALRAWRGLFPVRVTALAGALFATLWVTVFYGPEVMPNYWVAIGALAGVGCFLRVQADRRDRAALWGAGASAALMAWMRPTDTVWVVLPLLVLLVCVRRWRRPRLLAALVVGLGSGAVGWVVEAYVSFGGLGARLADASRIQGGLGWNIAVLDQLRSLRGQTLCRPCTGSVPAPELIAWWFALPLLAALGLVVAVRARRTAGTLLPLACATTAGIPYLFMIGYAAPRFLLPFYALLAIPVADALIHLVTTRRQAWRPVATTLVALALAGHVAVQYAVLENAVARSTAAREDWARTASELHRLGVRPPCVVTGLEALPIAFYAGCSSAQTQGHNASTTRAELLRTAQRTPTAALATAKDGPPEYARGWPSHRFGDLRIHVGPATRTGDQG